MPRLFSLTVRTVLVAVTVMFCLAGLAEAQAKPADLGLLPELSLYAGSKSCIECHGKFYQLWSTSRHGLAMQPYTLEFARSNLTSQTKDLVIGKYRYRADIGSQAETLLRQALQRETLTPQDRARIAEALHKLSPEAAK